jgi:RNA polymerase sigma factor (sigma-70 family)
MELQDSSIARTRANDVLSEAVVANENLVHWTVQRQWLGRLGYEDAVQEGRIALWRALERYDPRRGALSSYAVVAIRHAVWRAAGQARRGAHERLYFEPAGHRVGLAAEMDRVIERAQVAALVARLPKRLRTVVVLRYGLDGHGEATFEEIGRHLAVTRQRAHQLHGEALLRLGDPARSWPLRQHRGRNSAGDYRAYLARRRAWQRAGRRAR